MHRECNTKKNINQIIRNSFTLFLLFLISCSEQNPLPDQIFGLTLTQKLVGKEALDFVNKLHFNNVTSERNEIGFYEGSKGTAVIYITYYNDVKTVNQNFELMTEKISPENSVFIRSSFFEYNGKNIYRTFGMGQTHFVFVSGKNLYWLSAETVWSLKFLKEYLTHIE